MKKTILLTSVLVISGIFLAGCLDSKNTTASDKCVPAFYETKSDSNVQVGLVKEDVTTEFLTQDTYKVEEMEELQYGVLVNETEEGVYVVYELCFEDEDKPEDPLELDQEDYNYYVNTTQEDYGYFGNSAGGNTTSFIYESEGEEINSAATPGNYAVYALASEGDDEWFIVDTFKFEVKE